jgi:hypothetical protein
MLAFFFFSNAEDINTLINEKSISVVIKIGCYLVYIMSIQNISIEMTKLPHYCDWIHHDKHSQKFEACSCYI